VPAAERRWGSLKLVTGLEVAEAVELVHAGDGPIGRGGDERACEV